MIKGLLFCVFIAACAFLARLFSALTLSGAVAASVTGILVYLGFGLKGVLVLVLFFVTSSFFSKYKKEVKKEATEKTEKGDCRDWRQVAANGGIAALAGIGHFLTGEELWLFIFSVSLACANADTWASEIGVLSRKPPLSLRTFSNAAPGTSGAVSGAGTLAAFSGSFLIAAAVYFLFSVSLETAMLIFIFGFLGNVIDSIIGAYWQALYQCRVCQKETERLTHCGRKTKKIKGLSVLNNDMVNFLSGLSAAIIGVIFFL